MSIKNIDKREWAAGLSIVPALLGFLFLVLVGPEIVQGWFSFWGTIAIGLAGLLATGWLAHYSKEAEVGNSQ